jgi:hypothetical protein
MRLNLQPFCPDPEPTGTPAEPLALNGRSLGIAIILAAMKDYLSLQEEAHQSAAEFLYPQTPEWRSQYDWAVALVDGLNPTWLRDRLDRSRPKWEVQRSLCKRSSQNSRASKKRPVTHA